MSDATPQEVIVNYFVEEGLDPSYMSYDEIAEAVVTALLASGHLVEEVAPDCLTRSFPTLPPLNPLSPNPA
jgi:hypothetical protein